MKLTKVKSKWLFVIFVLMPTFLTALYNLIIASPVYISESRVIIKTVGDNTTSGIGAFLKSFGVSDASSSGSSLVTQFSQSRDTMNLLNKQFDIKNYYGNKGDLLSKFNPLGIDNSDENFYLYYTSKVVNAWVDTASNLVTIQTRAFDGKTAYELNKEILTQAENFINLINKRASLTAMSYYEGQINETRRKIDEASKKLVSFFKQTGVVSSEAQVASQVQIITELQKQLTEKKLEYARIQSLAPENPVLKTLKDDIKRIESETNKNFGILASQTGKHSVSLELAKAELQTLQAELNANIQAYIQAQSQAFMKHLFIETVQSPTMPDKAMEPKELKNIFTVFAVGFILWGIVSLLIAGVREHKSI
ncbi:hypothetical protein QI155_10480 [Thermodesulfovibrio sp. 1176]|uniref:hypothetical protein n=1 Tax=Thermodesulfovibrio sp. 1176 TaxID=3043424 RepID=UPI002482BC6C|nr:hypothetical protein [Thermodesulfovibrio sp. 1176]MDI1472957.1 hypothetical protein [Thermodesulfovibrio sp. 1176]